MGLEPLSPTYSSGRDFSLEVHGVRFSFSAADFASRVGAAALGIGLVDRGGLGSAETEDLIALVVHGEIEAPVSDLARHIRDHHDPLMSGDANLVHWLRRLVFRGAWIDQQVTDGALVPVFDETLGFRYRSGATGVPAAEDPLLPEWSGLTYRGAR